MKKEIIAFEVGVSVLNELFESLNISAHIEYDGDRIIGFKLASEDEWDRYTDAYDEYFPDFINESDYKSTRLKLIEFEKLVQAYVVLPNGPELSTPSDQLSQLEKNMQEIFSENNVIPLSVYPLFARWFTVCALLNIKKLNSDDTTCLDCVSFWKVSKDYLDKSLVFLISRMKLDVQHHSEDSSEIVMALKKLNVLKNYNLLSFLEGAVEVKDKSLVKKEELLTSNVLINKVLADLLSN